MVLQVLTAATIAFLTKLAAAEVARIDDGLYIINNKAGWAGSDEPTQRKIEDHELIFDTDYHTFGWWEICHETTQVEPGVFKVGDETISFLTLAPA